MKLTNGPATRALLLLFYLTALAASAKGQGKPEPQTDDVLRINTDLIQTAVTVTDGKGRFVEGLQRENFELRVEGKPQPITFFERVRAGSLREEQLTTVRDGSNMATATTAPDASVSRGRTIIFFIDDMHLSLSSLSRTRELLLHFIDKEMGQRDMVAIASATGQVGFLQQFTNNKEVLKAALSRLNHRPYVINSYATGTTPMTEYMALTIDNKTDDKVVNFYIEECLKQSPRVKSRVLMAALRATCEVQVRNSARAVLLQASNITESMYLSLESLMRSSARLPGRKLTFFVSDGFLMDTGRRGASLVNHLQRIIDAAVRAGVVVYTIDARGLVSGALDATGNVPFDPNGRLESTLLREVAASQDALNALAVDTGGRALRNQNLFDRFVSEALDETSNYYLLAWRPETEAQKDKKFSRIEVSVIGKPELTVRLPRGFVQGAQVASKPVNTAAPEMENTSGRGAAVNTPAGALRDALTDFYVRGSLPILLSLSYLDTPNNGMVLTSSMQIESSGLAYGPDGKQPAAVDLAGVVLNDKGKIVTSFKNHLNIDPLASDPAQGDTSGIIYNHRAPLQPGIYQVRVAARDEKSGRVGSAMQWIVIPDLGARRLTLSSLLVDVRALETAKGKGETQQVQFSVSHRFARSSHLGFLVFIYNATRSGSGTPNLRAQVEVLRDGKLVAAGPQRQLNGKAVTDLARILYEDGLTLKGLERGRYELRVTVSDLIANSTASQQIDFEVE